MIGFKLALTGVMVLCFCILIRSNMDDDWRNEDIALVCFVIFGATAGCLATFSGLMIMIWSI